MHFLTQLGRECNEEYKKTLQLFSVSLIILRVRVLTFTGLVFYL